MNRISKLNFELSPKKRALFDLLLKQENLNSSLLPIYPIPQRGNLPLSFNQQRLYNLEQLNLSGHYVYNVPVGFRLVGFLDLLALEQSLVEIVRRHEIMRTTFAVVNGQAVQVVNPEVSLRIPFVDLQKKFPEQQEVEAQRLIAEEVKRPFNLIQGSLWRIKLLRLFEQEHVLLITMHHIITDGWSFDVLFREMSLLYEAFSTNKPSPLPELPIQYSDFAQWQHQWLQGDVLESQLNYWKAQLAEQIPMLKLPTDHSLPPVQNYRGARQSLELTKNLTDALKALSKREGSTLFMTLLAAFKTLLYCYTGQKDIILCSPVACRNRIEIEGLIGYFNNILPIRTNLSGNPSFREILDQVRQVVLKAYEHQDVPFQNLANLPNLIRTPLSRGMFVLQNTPSQTLKLREITTSLLDVNTGTANFDLSVSIEENAGKLTAVLDYKIDLFNATTITQMLEHFQTLLESLAANPAQHLLSLPSFRKTESHKFDKNGDPTHSLTLSDQFNQEPQETYVAPRDSLELQLTKIWEQVLGIQPIGVRDNFFSLGGHSLLSVRLFAQIKKAFKKNLPLATLFASPTIEQQANILRSQETSSPWYSLVPIQPGGSRPPLFGIHHIYFKDLSRYLGPSQPVYSLHYGMGELSDRAVSLPNMEGLAAHYIEEMRSLQPEGPYFLMGLSFGGLVAYEMAQQLVAQGQQIGLLALFDTYIENSQKLLPLHQRLSNLLKLSRTEFLRRAKDNLTSKFRRFRYGTQYQPHIYVPEPVISILKNYTPKTYSGRVLLFKAMDHFSVSYSSDPPEIGWRKFVNGKLEIHEVSGTHIGILEEPHVQVVAEKLRDYLI
ncbi:MAG: non-ribosomal peptide synthetase [Dolichospermum sp. DL01]|nr:MAG: non-ribosomal peptide synthetase [Dolichospermum sp. DL01]